MALPAPGQRWRCLPHPLPGPARGQCEVRPVGSPGKARGGGATGRPAPSVPVALATGSGEQLVGSRAGRLGPGSMPEEPWSQPHSLQGPCLSLDIIAFLPLWGRGGRQHQDAERGAAQGQPPCPSSRPAARPCALQPDWKPGQAPHVTLVGACTDETLKPSPWPQQPLPNTHTSTEVRPRPLAPVKRKEELEMGGETRAGGTNQKGKIKSFFKKSRPGQGAGGGC